MFRFVLLPCLDLGLTVLMGLHTVWRWCRCQRKCHIYYMAVGSGTAVTAMAVLFFEQFRTQKCRNVRVDEFASDKKMAMHDSHFDLSNVGEMPPINLCIDLSNIGEMPPLNLCIDLSNVGEMPPLNLCIDLSNVGEMPPSTCASICLMLVKCPPSTCASICLMLVKCPPHQPVHQSV